MHVPGVRDFPITCQWIPSALPQTATDYCQITMNVYPALGAVDPAQGWAAGAHEIRPFS